jgi:hypothetical protein
MGQRRLKDAVICVKPFYCTSPRMGSHWVNGVITYCIVYGIGLATGQSIIVIHEPLFFAQSLYIHHHSSDVGRRLGITNTDTKIYKNEHLERLGKSEIQRLKHVFLFECPKNGLHPKSAACECGILQ